MKPDTKENILNHWNSFADWYNHYFTQASSKFYRAFLPFLDFPPESTVLETACGAGNGLELLIEKAPHSSITGTDHSQAMLDYARSRIGDRVQLQIADNESLPFGDASFTHYISNLSLHIVPDPCKMLAEAFRVLKPGGQLVVSVIGEGTTFIQLNVVANRLAKRAPVNLELRPQTYLSDQSIVLGLIRDAGLQLSLKFHETYHFPLKTTEDALNWVCTLPAVAALEETDPEHYNEVRAGVLQEIETLMIRNCKPIEFRCDVYLAKKPLDS